MLPPVPGLTPSLLAAEPASAAELSIDTAVGTEGYFVLSWTVAPDAGNSVLQQSDGDSFGNVREYRIDPQGSMTLSGFPDGQYHFRAGTPGNWSDPVTVTISHHSLNRAFAFFFLGLSLFIVLVITIVRGNHQHGLEVAGTRQQEDPHG